MDPIITQRGRAVAEPRYTLAAAVPPAPGKTPFRPVIGWRGQRHPAMTGS